MQLFVRRQCKDEKYGPFENLKEAAAFVLEQQEEDPEWDYYPVIVGYWPQYPQGWFMTEHFRGNCKR